MVGKTLNHPQYCRRSWAGRIEGTHFLVLKLVEGDTLADRIKEGPIHIEESSKLALQIAEALVAASAVLDID
jgi:serine/threonine protein kinase